MIEQYLHETERHTCDETTSNNLQTELIERTEMGSYLYYQACIIHKSIQCTTKLDRQSTTEHKKGQPLTHYWAAERKERKNNTIGDKPFMLLARQSSHLVDVVCR